jgi:hypothetical protein
VRVRLFALKDLRREPKSLYCKSRMWSRSPSRFPVGCLWDVVFATSPYLRWPTKWPTVACSVLAMKRDPIRYWLLREQKRGRFYPLCCERMRTCAKCCSSLVHDFVRRLVWCENCGVKISWLPPGAPIWGFTAHVGGRAPSRVHIWVSPIFSHRLFLGSLPACVFLRGLVLSSLLGFVGIQGQGALGLRVRPARPHPRSRRHAVACNP